MNIDMAEVMAMLRNMGPAEHRALARLFISISDGDAKWHEPSPGMVGIFEALGEELTELLIQRLADAAAGVHECHQAYLRQKRATVQ